MRRVALNQSLVGWVAAHRTMIEVPDVFVDPRFLHSAAGWWQRHGFTSFVGMPIIQDGRLLGVLSFVSARPLRLGAEERELLDTLVGQAALAIRNARLFAATEGREREAAALFDITRRLGATLDVGEILGIVSEGTAQGHGLGRGPLLPLGRGAPAAGGGARGQLLPRAGRVAGDPLG